MQFSFAVLLFPKMKTRREKKEKEEGEKEEQGKASNWQRILVAEWRRIPARELRLPLIKPLECSTRRCKLSKGSNKKSTRTRGEEGGKTGMRANPTLFSMTFAVLFWLMCFVLLPFALLLINVYNLLICTGSNMSLSPHSPLFLFFSCCTTN